MKAKFTAAIVLLVLAGMAVLSTPESAMAQCIMCYRSAAASGDRTIAVLKIGILIMIVPTLAILSMVAWMTWQRSRLTFPAEPAAASDAAIPVGETPPR